MTTPDNRCVIRLTTSAWADKRGLHLQRNIRYMRKLCIGYNVLSENVDTVDAMYVIKRIVNLDKCSDGIYEVMTCNQSTDFETGYVDGYDFRLVPFNLEGEKNDES